MANATGFDYLTAFDDAAGQILKDLFGEAPTKAPPVAHFGDSVPLQPVSISVGITGALSGYFRIGMDEDTARAVAGGMLGEDVPELEEMSLSALCELTNMIAGNARSSLNQDGLVSDITPPAIVRSAGASETWFNLRALSIPLSLAVGTIVLTVILTIGIRPTSKPEVKS